tara:strand:- start:1943 stop:2341 length:399 start_codon:yes stop_codon:yes gene_type:complete
MDKEILKIALNTKNLSFLNNYTHYTKLKNSTCGDEVKIYLIVKKGKIIDFKYEGESCVYCQASASLLSRSVKNKPINKIKVFLKGAENLFENKRTESNKDMIKFLKIMNKSNILRKDCLLLPLKATLKALKN